MIYLEELNISIIIKLLKILYQKNNLKKIYFIYSKKTDFIFIILEVPIGIKILNATIRTILITNR